MNGPKEQFKILFSIRCHLLYQSNHCSFINNLSEIPNVKR